MIPSVYSSCQSRSSKAPSAPAARSIRRWAIFYDVPKLNRELIDKDVGRTGKPPSRIVDSDALSDPEGSLLLIDAGTAPYVHKYKNVQL
jgi:hypothetical protein